MTKSANMRASLIPYPVIAAAVGGNPEAVNRVIQHYSGYIAALSMRTSYDKNGFPHSLVDEDTANKEQRKNGKYSNECFEKDARFPFTASFPRPGTPVIILCILH